MQIERITSRLGYFGAPRDCWIMHGDPLVGPPLDALFCWPNPRAAHFWSKLGRRLNGSEWLAANPDLAYVLDPTVKP